MVSSLPSSSVSVAARPKRVALLVETSKAFGRGVLQGIGRWQREHEPWRVYADERGFNEAVPRELNTADLDGVIIRLQRS
jgi:LacI family transcriptional regulator